MTYYGKRGRHRRAYYASWPFACWGSRYAYAAYGDRSDACDDEAPSTFQESRHHSRRGGSFGARRPLRHLSYRLDLDEPQQRVAARVLDRLKMDLEQARLDEKKTLTEVANRITGEDVSVDDLRDALAPRVSSAEQLRTTIASAMQELAAVLDRDQREELAHLLRSGAFRI